MSELSEELLERSLLEVQVDKTSKDSLKRFRGYWDKLPDKFIVRASVFRSKGTASQRRYYFALLRMISKRTGDDVRDLHEYIKHRYLSSEIRIKITGTDEFIPGTTRELTTAEYGDLIENVKRMAAESQYNIILPEAGDFLFDDF